MDGIQLDLSIEQGKRIAGFLGYGNPAESVWFVGIEEGLGRATSKDAIQNLGARGSFEEIMDLRDAHHQKLWERGQLIDFDRKPPFTPVWQWMAKIMCASSGSDWREYLKSSLGRRKGDTFLTELSPIPSSSPRNKTWMRALAALDSDLAEKLDRRKRKLLQMYEEKLHASLFAMVMAKQRLASSKLFSASNGVRSEPESQLIENGLAHFYSCHFSEMVR